MNNSSVISANTSKTELATILREQFAIVAFTKKDGTHRRMLCTLHKDVVVPHEKKTDRIVEPKDNVLPVWDVDAVAWRSINIDTVHSIEIVEVL
jgi:hypothetical protein